jgi:hypothetical protein
LSKGHDTWPAARVTRIGGVAQDSQALFDKPLIQVDVWGGPKVQAEEIAQLIRERLADGLPFRQDGCLKAVTRMGGLRYLPDATWDPAKPRYILDVEFLTGP